MSGDLPAGRGASLQRSVVGVGSALRTVRESRGLSLEEAARDTRVRPEFLEAIEAEDFERLLGDVHVRGCLRTYATYLRLSPDKVVSMYEQEFGSDDQVEAAQPPLRTVPVLGRRRRRDDHRLWILVAAVVLVLAAAFGVLSARRPAPPPAELAGATGLIESSTARPISVALLARRPVDVTIVADGGAPQRYTLEADEGRSFEADSELTVRLSEGAITSVTVNGTPHGYPGERGVPWEDTYSYEASPSPGS
jgi:transcriptional regulator with XRE-family HTH domain